MSEAHKLVDALERDIIATIPGAVVTVHLDPDDEGIMEPHTRVRDGTLQPSVHLHHH